MSPDETPPIHPEEPPLLWPWEREDARKALVEAPLDLTPAPSPPPMSAEVIDGETPPIHPEAPLLLCPWEREDAEVPVEEYLDFTPAPAPPPMSAEEIDAELQRLHSVLAQGRQLRSEARASGSRAGRTPGSAGRTSPRRAVATRGAALTHQPTALQGTRPERGALQRWRERSHGHGEAPLRALLAAASESAALTVAMSSGHPTRSPASTDLSPGHQQAPARAHVVSAAATARRRDEDETGLLQDEGHQVSRSPHL